MRTLPVAVTALVLVTGCSSGGTPQAAPTSLPPTRSATPKPKPKPKPTPASPTPTATTPPPVTGEVIGVNGALLARVDPGEPRQVTEDSDCAAVFPDVTRPTCGAVTMDGGRLLWGTGRLGGHGMVRLLVQQAGGYVARYEGRDDGRSWRSVKVYATPLTGHGTDGLVVLVRLADTAATYDLLTWVAGGPLVLRAHRPPLADGRLAPRDGGLDEYALRADGVWVRRRVAWDGRQFRLSAGTAATTVPGR
jgi:hypothetical protein